MNTLKAVQTLSKIGKVLSKIVYICCIIGFCGCAVGIVAMLIGGESVKLSGVALHSILQTEAGIDGGTIWAAIAVGLILFVGEFFISNMAYRYFDRELKAGTPFTLNGAKELMHLGISVIWIPIVAVVLAQVAQGMIAQFMENAEKLNLDGFNSVALGIMFIVMSLLCKLGAEEAQKNEPIQKVE